MVKLVTLIESRVCRGKGTPEEPYRTVMEHWTLDGTLVADNDSQPVPPNQWAEP